MCATHVLISQLAALGTVGMETYKLATDIAMFKVALQLAKLILRIPICFSLNVHFNRCQVLVPVPLLRS